MTNKNHKNKKRMSLGKALRNTAIAAGVSALSFLPFNASGQSQDTQDSLKNEKNYIYPYQKFSNYHTAGQGIIAKNYVPELSDVDFDSTFYAREGKLDIRFEDAEKILSKAQKFSDSRKHSTPDKKAYKNYLKSLEEYVGNHPSDSESLKKLNEAVDNGTLFTKKDSVYNNLENGIYAVVYESKGDKDRRVKSQTVPLFVHVKNSEKEKEKKDDTKDEDRTNYEFLPRKEKNKGSKYELGAIAQANCGPDMYGAGFGIKYGPVAFVANVYQGGNELVESVSDKGNGLGRYFSGKEINKDFLGVGGNLEAHLGDNFFLGGGANLWNYTNKTIEKINSSNGNVISKNTNSKSKSDMSWNGYVGFKTDITDDSKIGFQIGVDTKKDIYGGIRFSF